ncbi:MAG: hypothetical protein H5U40_11110 [Polyangiaceae bacterium]|nr:hypothetical protein [Polyangiaceae bacterium]
MRSEAIPATMVDGQRLLLPDAATLGRLAEEPLLDGRPIGVGRLLSRFVGLSAKLPELVVALGESREPDKPWIVYHLLRKGDEHVRVHLESQVCTACGASRITGIGRHYNLYEGTPDPWAALEAAIERPTARCPECGGDFPQPPLWVDQPSAR